MMNRLLILCVFITGTAFGKADFHKDSLMFEAEDAIRYAKFLDFHKFGEDWSAELDETGKVWIVSASRTYLSRKIIDDDNQVYLSDDNKKFMVKEIRLIHMDAHSGKVLDRKKRTRISVQ